jgi:hypothetical protein
MTSRHSRLGRLFCCLLMLGMAAFAADPSKTTISDVIYRADGTPASGTLLISWGVANNRNLIGRFTTPVLTLARLSRVQDFYIRAYDASAPPLYSRDSALLHVDYPF